MKKFFKYGIGVLLPFALVAQIFWWLFGVFESFTLSILPASMQYHWWYSLVVVAAIIVAIFIIGVLFSTLAPLRWIKEKIERYIINNIPGVNKIYKFGKEVSDSFISDIKEDGDLVVVEVMFAGQKSLGALTDVKNNIVFIPTAPNPLNGFLVKTEDYVILNMTFMELVQALASLGKVNGSGWRKL